MYNEIDTNFGLDIYKKFFAYNLTPKMVKLTFVMRVTLKMLHWRLIDQKTWQIEHQLCVTCKQHGFRLSVLHWRTIDPKSWQN